MPTDEEAFSEKLLSIFKLEAEEHLNILSEGLLFLEKDPTAEETASTIERIYREAHSLKGASRAVNLERVQTICQELENILAKWKKRELTPTPTLFSTLYKTLDLLKMEIEQQHGNITIEEVVHELQSHLETKKEETQPPSKSVETPVREEPKAAQEAPKITREESKTTKEETIRISVKKLNQLFHRIEELLLFKLSSQQHLSDLQTFFEEFLELKKLKKQTNYAHAGEWIDEIFKRLHDRLHKFIKKSRQDNYFISSTVDTLLETAKEARMQPFSTVVESFPRMVRDLSLSLNKEARFECINEKIEMDKRILEDLKDPLIHLIRNSIDHGLETKEERIKQGKNSWGSIKINLSKISGNIVEMTVSDDGRGIDPQKIKETAIKKGVITPTEASTLTDKEAIYLIFQSGMSTSAIITDLSGRGLGLGIVLEKIEKMGGNVAVETTLGIGTTFKIVFPLTLATFRGIRVIVGNQEFILPINHVKKVLRLPFKQIKTIEGRLTIFWEERNLPFAFLSHILQLPTAEKPLFDSIIYMLIIKAGELVVAIGVDSIENENEVFAKGLGSHLKSVKNIAAATILESGKVIPIVDCFDIAKGALSRRETIAALTEAQLAQPKKKKVLVVEDSITTRVLLKNILESKGYEVKTAVDGQEGLDILQSSQQFNLILSDVEMPKLTGFQLLEKVKATEALKEIPFILCTTRASQEDLLQGINLGANAYIDKSNFTQSNLLDIIEKLI